MLRLIDRLLLQRGVHKIQEERREVVTLDVASRRSEEHFWSPVTEKEMW